MWQEAKEQLAELMVEVMDTEAFRIEQLSNKEVKMFLADLYLPYDKRDHSKQLVENTIADVTEERSVVNDEEENSEELTMLQKVGRLVDRGVAFIRTYFENTTALTDLDRDMSFVLPHNIAFEEDKECVKIDDGFETTLIVPTNNRIIDNSLVKTLAEHPNVFNVTFRLFPENKIRIISTLERKVHNESLTVYEEQENSRLGTIPQKHMSETEAYIDTLNSDHQKEVFKLCILVNVEAKTQSGLKRAVQEITKTVEDKLFIRVYKAVYEQKKHYLASKLFPQAKGRNSFYIDTDRLASLTPLPFYTFHDKDGFLLGSNAFTGEPAFFDPENFDYVESASAIVLAKTGQGKSTLFKLWQTRGSFLAHKNIIIDNTGEYSARIGKELDMKIFKVGTDEAKINPFQLFISTHKKDRQEIIKKQINQVLMPCFSALLSEVNYKSGLVDKLLFTYYESPVKQHNMRTFVEFLYEYKKRVDVQDKDTITEYVTCLERFTKYSLSNVFGDEMDFKNLHTYQNIVFDVQEITKLRGANSQYVVSAILHIIVANLWIMAQVKRESMLVFIDEAHYLLESDETSSYLAKLAKDGRKDKIYLVLSTQDPLDFIGNKNGERVITNTFTKIYGKLEDIPERYLKILDINEQLAQTIKILPRGHFYMQRGKESMFFYTEFLNEWEKLITDTERTNYRDSLETVLRTNHAAL